MSTHIPDPSDQVRVFAHQRDSDQIATLVPYGENKKGDPVWRLTYWKPCGPVGHDVLTLHTLERELRWDWCESETAGMVLESWSDTTEWSTGLKQCQFVAAWNTLSYHGRHDLCQLLDHTKSLDEALELIPRVLAKLKESDEKTTC